MSPRVLPPGRARAFPRLPSIEPALRPRVYPPVGASPRAVASATCVLALGPNGIGATWRDESGAGNHATITGATPTSVSTAGGTLNGLAFDGVNDRLDGAIQVASDQACTVFALAAHDGTQTSGIFPLLELSDTGVKNRSIQLGDGNSYRFAMRRGNSDVQAFYANVSSALQLCRYTFGANFTEVREGGLWKAGNALDLTARAPTVYRVGAYLDGSGWWKGSLYALRVYSGVMSEKDAELVELDMLRAASLSTPFVWPDARSVLHTDPQFLLPPVLRCVVGQPVSIFLDSVQLSTDGYRELTITSDLPIDRTYPDRVIVTPPSAGDYAFALAADGYSASTTIRAAAALAGAPTKNVHFVGDSNMERAATGMIEHFAKALGAQVAMIGSIAASSGYSARHEGHGGFAFITFLDGTTVQGTSSPYYVGGAVNMASFAETHEIPDVIFVWCGPNDVYGSTSGTIAANVATAIANSNTLLAYYQAAWPGVSVVYMLPNPGNRKPDSGADEAGRLNYRTNEHAIAKAELLEYRNREAERIFVCAASFQFDSVEGYIDFLHANVSPGHRQIALPVVAEYAAAQAASAVVKVVSANIDGVVGANKLTVVWSEACTAAATTGLTLTGVASTPTVSSVASGSGTATHVYNLSANAVGTDTPVLHVALTRVVESSSGARKAAVGKATVTVTNLDNPVLTAPGTLVYWAGAESVTLASSNVTQFTDKGPLGNHFVQATGTKQGIQSTTGSGNKLVTVDGIDDFYQCSFAASIPANCKGTIYHAAQMLRWLGSWETMVNVCKDLVEGAGHYDAGILLRGSVNSRMLTGYNADPTNNWVQSPVPDNAAHVWAFSFTPSGNGKLYRDGVLVDTVTCNAGPAALVAARLFTLWFAQPGNCGNQAFGQGVLFAGSDAVNEHDASQVATISTYLATLLT